MNICIHENLVWNDTFIDLGMPSIYSNHVEYLQLAIFYVQINNRHSTYYDIQTTRLRLFAFWCLLLMNEQNIGKKKMRFIDVFCAFRLNVSFWFLCFVHFNHHVCVCWQQILKVFTKPFVAHPINIEIGRSQILTCRIQRLKSKQRERNEK